MSTMTRRVSGRTELAGGGRAAQATDVVLSEWIKLRSLRATWSMVALAVVAAVGIAALAASVDVRDWDQMSSAQRAGVDPLSDSFVGFMVSQLAFAALGVLTITGEYSSGLIRTTFTAVPARTGVLLGKAAAVGALALVTGLVTATASFGVAQAILARQHLGLSVTEPYVVRGIVAAAGYLGSVSLLGLCLGVLLRHTGPAVAVLVVLLFLAPQLLHGSAAWVTDIANALPGTVIRRLVTLAPWPGAPSIAHSCMVIIAYPLVSLVVAAVVLRRRDA